MTRQGGKLLLTALVVAVALACPAANAWAAAGEPDPSFGDHGRVVAPSEPLGVYTPTAIAIDQRGRIVVAGLRAHALAVVPVVIRFEPDGTLDPSFGDGGFIGPIWPNLNSFVDGVAIDGAGHIVVGGTSNGELAVARLREDGSLDPTFAGGGLLTVDAGGPSSGSLGSALAIDGQGRILLAGATGIVSPDNPKPSPNNERVVAIRVTPEGALDSSFGEGGIATVDFGGPSEALGMTTEASGAVVLAGGAEASGARQFAVARLDSSGRPDPSFGVAGRETFNPPGAPGGEATAVAVDASGRLLVVGSEGPEGSEVAPVVRLLGSGLPDPSFGRAGAFLLPLPGPGVANDLAIDSKRRLVVVGGVRSGSVWDPFLARLLSDGSMDPSFGSGGLVRDSRLASSFSPGANASGVDSTGRYVIAAEHELGFGVGRYLAEPEPKARCAGKKATIVGTRGRDVLKGTKRRDVIAGLRGNDVIRGLGGNDLICGGVGRDRLFGGKGADRLFGGKGADLLVGGPGRDRLHGGHGRGLER